MSDDEENYRWLYEGKSGNENMYPSPNIASIKRNRKNKEISADQLQDELGIRRRILKLNYLIVNL